MLLVDILLLFATYTGAAYSSLFLSLLVASSTILHVYSLALSLLFQDISSEMDGCPDEINVLSDKAEYLIKTSSISPKDKDKVSHDLDQLNNTYKNYKNDEDTIKAK